MDNLPYVLALIGAMGITAVCIFNIELFKLFSMTTFSSLSSRFVNNEIPIVNKCIESVIRIRTASKFVEAHRLMQAYELTSKIFLREKLDGYKLIALELLNSDTKLKVFYSVTSLTALLIYLFTGNLVILWEC